ncbi:MAG: SDR family NAD(P)-dependent oxidoreductase [Bacteroidales bacterium]|nr:SDR family NAD(P)-dependent oxidoreductase [Bacteroidales bacterium]MDZ4204359.1 SDR family NAD(P)-dependent oxidoreductase [Bacteroidales bacterium]
MKTAIVTGAYGAIGKAIAEGIAIEKDFRVVLVGRGQQQLTDAVRVVSSRTNNPNVEGALVDLSSLASIRAFADTFLDPLHVLVNNAATAPRQRLLSVEGIEMQWAVNVMGYFRMTQLFTPHLMKANGARVVNVASYWAGGLDFNDPEFKRRPYNNDVAYRQSKQANRMMSAAFSERLMGFQITVNACHPGDVNSKLSNSLGFGGHENPVQGAETPVWLALSREVEGVTGKYFEHRNDLPCAFMNDSEGVLRLYSILNR